MEEEKGKEEALQDFLFFFIFFLIFWSGTKIHCFKKLKYNRKDKIRKETSRD